jgi:FkbM family methyltransferase
MAALKTKLTRVGSRLDASVKTIRLCKNWPTILFGHLRGKSQSRFVFRNGIDLRCSRSDPWNFTIFDEIFLKNHYSRYFDVEPGDVVVDVGGNVGMFLAYAEYRRCARVIVAEPSRENAEAIQDNITRNAVDNATLERVAISTGPGTVALWVDPLDSGGHTITDAGSSGRAESEEVSTVSFGELLAKHGIEAVDFLKMDCEGAEGMIFEGLKPEELARIRKVAIEFHDEASTLSHTQIDALLRDAGFTTWVESTPGSPYGYIWAQRR